MTQPEGAQVIDFGAFNHDDPRETLGSSVTRRRKATHLTTGNQIWTRAPWERPMFTIVEDTVVHRASPSRAVTHDMASGRCSQASRITRYGIDSPGCEEILEAVIAPFGLGLEYVHDPFNIFMRTGVDEKGHMFWEAPDDVTAGDYIDLVAEMTVIVAASACPGLSSGPGERPFGVEIYDL